MTLGVVPVGLPCLVDHFEHGLVSNCQPASKINLHDVSNA